MTRARSPRTAVKIALLLLYLLDSKNSFAAWFRATAQQDFDHRKRLMLARLADIKSVFCSDSCAHTVMPNHYHLVLYINKAPVDALIA
ncbi:MAG: hypothetical protein V7784_07325 [Oceanospirillaceae bacterium]